jgi:sulfur carrier protein ThiS
VIEFTVNGCTQHCERPLAISELLQRMALGGKKVAVERNGEIVRAAHDDAARRRRPAGNRRGVGG